MMEIVATFIKTFFAQLWVSFYKNALVLKGRKLSVAFTVLLPSLVVLVLYIIIVSILAANTSYPRFGVENGVMRYGGGALIAAGAVGQSALLLNTVALEKRTHLLQSLRLLSMWESVHWITWFVTVAFISLVGVVLSIFLAVYAFDLKVYSFVDGGILLLTHSSLTLATIAASSIAAAMVQTPVTIGLVIFLSLAGTVGFAFLGNVLPVMLGGLASEKWYWWGFAPLPVYHFAGIFSDMTFHVYNYDSVTGEPSPHFYGWKEMTSADELTQAGFGGGLKQYDDFPFKGWKALLWLGTTWPIYLVAAWYISQVICTCSCKCGKGNEVAGNDLGGAPRPVWFIFNPSFWCPRISSAAEEAARWRDPTAVGVISAGDAIGAARQRSGINSSLVTHMVSKSYPGGVTALKEVSLTIEPGELCVLLGQNGAGKTTLIRLLTGATEPTHGEAFVMGYSLTEDIATLQALQFIALCPQFDIFWPSLTARHHLYIVSMLKGLWRIPAGEVEANVAAEDNAAASAAGYQSAASSTPDDEEEDNDVDGMNENDDDASSASPAKLFCGMCCGRSRRRVAAHVEEKLRLVGLTSAGNQRVDTFSGGMKRRLSVAMAACGDPRVIFFDEPTTGMDPLSRRRVWKAIEKLKKDRLIVMTTHNMEEADALGDKVAILSRGSLRACGSSLFLKRRFGAGYQVTLTAKAQSVPRLRRLVGRTLPGADIIEGDAVASGSMTVGCPTALLPSLAPFLRVVEKFAMWQSASPRSASGGGQLSSIVNGGEPLILEWGISNSTLEEVFLRLVAQQTAAEEESHTSAGDVRQETIKWSVDLRAATSSLPGGLAAVSRALNIGDDGEHFVDNADGSSSDGESSKSSGAITALLGGGGEGGSGAAGDGTVTLQRSDIERVLTLLRGENAHAKELRKIVSSIFRHAPLREYMSSAEYQRSAARLEDIAAGRGGGGDDDDDDDEFMDALADLDREAAAATAPAAAAATQVVGFDARGAEAGDGVVVGVDNAAVGNQPPRLSREMPRLAPVWQQIYGLMMKELAMMRKQLCAIICRTCFIVTCILTLVITSLLLGLVPTFTPPATDSPSASPTAVPPPASLHEHEFFDLDNFLVQSSGSSSSSSEYSHSYSYPQAFSKVNPTLTLFATLCFSLATMFAATGMVLPLANEKHEGTWMMLRVQGMRCCPFWTAVYGAGALQMLFFGLLSISLGYLTRAEAFTNSAWWIWIGLICAYTHCAMGMVVLFAATAPSRRLLGLATSFGLLLFVIIAMVVCAVMTSEEPRLPDDTIRFRAWPWFLLVVPLFSYPRAVYTLMSFGTQENALPLTNPTEATMEVYEITGLLLLVGTAAGLVGMYFFAVLPAQHAKWTSSAQDPLLCLGEGGCARRACKKALQRRRKAQLAAVYGEERVVSLIGSNTFSHTSYGAESPSEVHSSIGSIAGSDGNSSTEDVDVRRSRNEAKLAHESIFGDTASDDMGEVRAAAETHAVAIFGVTKSFNATGGGSSALESAVETIIDLCATLFRLVLRFALGLCGRGGSDVSGIDSTSTTNGSGGGRKKKIAVDDMWLCLPYGEVFGLLGPNGAGKSTLLHMLAGLLSPTEGVAMVGGFDVASERSEVYRVLGICPQHDTLYDALTVQQHLRLYARLKGVPLAKENGVVQRVASRIRLHGDAFGMPASSLSGGMRRRLSLGIALIGDPRVLMLDEPTTGLDPEARRLIWEIISEERASGKRAIVLTTHLMEEADALSSRIAIMAGGKVRVVGTQQRIKDRFGEGLRISLAIECGPPAPVSAAAALARGGGCFAGGKAVEDSDEVASAVQAWIDNAVAGALVLSRDSARHVPGATLPTQPRVQRVHRLGGSFVFMVPRSFECSSSSGGGDADTGRGGESDATPTAIALTQVSALFETLVAAQRGGVFCAATHPSTGIAMASVTLKDWSIRQASLEEVFVKVAEDAEIEKGVDTS